MLKVDSVDIPDKHHLSSVKKEGSGTKPTASEEMIADLDETTPETMPLQDRLSAAQYGCHKSNGRCDVMPEAMRMDIKVDHSFFMRVGKRFSVIDSLQIFYTTSLKEKVEEKYNQTAEQWINDVMTHAQAHYCLYDSLGTRLKLAVNGYLDQILK